MTDHDKNDAMTQVINRQQTNYALNPLLEEGPDGVIPRVVCINGGARFCLLLRVRFR